MECLRVVWLFVFFKQKTAYEMRISDWSSDVCSSDLERENRHEGRMHHQLHGDHGQRLAQIAADLEGCQRGAKGEERARGCGIAEQRQETLGRHRQRDAA